MADYILSAKITGDSKDFSKAFGDAEEKIKNFSEKTQGMGDKLQDAGGKMQKAGGKVSLMSAPVVLLGKQVFNTGAEFEAAMSKVQAISGATGNDLELLEDKAREMGATTRYSASEAADAMSFMALAGYDTTQMIDALPAVLDLATAGELDLARASEVVTGNLNAFGLEAEEAARVSDVLAFAQANSGTSAEELASALEVVAPSAAAAGNSIEGTSAIIGILADQNIKGSKAGTYLNSMFNDLQKSAEGGAVAIGETSVAVYDAEGNFRDMGEILVDVEAATQGMTEEQKNNALMAIFQQQSMKGVNSILNAGTEELVNLTAGINDSTGAAGEMAAIMDDNLAGSVAGMSSSFDELKLRLFDVAEKGFKNVVDKVTSVIDWFAGLDDKTLGIIVTVGALVVAIGPLLLIFGTLVSGIGKVIGVGGKLIGNFGKIKAAGSMLMGGLQSTVGFIFSPAGAILVGIAAAIAIGVLLYKNWDTIKTKASALKTSISTKFNQIKDAITKPIDAAKETVSDIVDSIKGFFTNMKLKLPKITVPKLPTFSITGKFGFNPLSVPKLDINWNAKGGIFTKPTLLGGGQGVGEAGAEAVLPIEKLGGMMANTLSRMGFSNDANNGNGNNSTVVNVNLNNANIYDTRDIKEVSRDLATQVSREVSFG